MVALETPQAQIGWHAEPFTLKSTDGHSHSLNELRGEKGTLIIFMCNHCPYVLKQLDRMKRMATDLQKIGVAVVAINSNDAASYPEDSFENMQRLSQEYALPFPYLYDESQAVAKAYGAVCTPDFFGFNADLTLQYRGRLDSSWSGIEPSPKEELIEAMQQIVQTGSTTKPQQPSIGCSIKWKNAAYA